MTKLHYNKMKEPHESSEPQVENSWRKLKQTERKHVNATFLVSCTTTQTSDDNFDPKTITISSHDSDPQKGLDLSTKINFQDVHAGLKPAGSKRF